MPRFDESSNGNIPNRPEQKGFRHFGDGIAGEITAARLQALNATTLAYQDVQIDNASGGILVAGGTGGGGGGAVTVADGADVAQGATTDASSANTVVGLLKAIKTAITGTLTVATHAVTQSGVWTVARSWTLSSATDSVNVGNFPATQPVSGPLTDTQLRASAVPVSGPLTDTQLRATRVPVDGSGVTQPVSGTVTSNQGTANATPWNENVAQWIGSTAPTVGQKAMASSLPVVLASDQSSIDVTPAAPVATDYLPVRVTDGSVFIENQATYYLYQRPRVTTAAATDFFDLFNAVGSGKKLRILSIFPVVEITAASAIIPSWVFSVIVTSAVGTGGTAHTFEGAASPTTALVNISRVDESDAALPAQVTARSLPTGGATASRFLFDITLVSEETNSATYDAQGINWVPQGTNRKEIVLPEGKGIKIRQVTATASTGTNFGWLVAFTLT